MLLNNSAVKINSFQYGNNNRQLNQGNHNELPVPLFSNRMNHMNNYNVIPILYLQVICQKRNINYMLIYYIFIIY